LYELGETGEPIVFTSEGDWIAYLHSLQKLLDFVKKQNATSSSDARQDSHDGEEEDGEEEWTMIPRRIKLSCGHTTTGVDAEEVIEQVLQFFENVIAGHVPVVKSQKIRGETVDTWREAGGDARFAVRAPRRLCEEVRRLRTAT